MRVGNWLLSTAGALVLGLLASPTYAAPMSGTVADLKGTAESAAVEQVRHRCYRHRGHLHCPRHGRRHYHHYGYGPGINLHFGHRGRHHHHRRHRNW